MLFNSLSFLIFLPIVFTIYWLLRKQLRWQNAFVVVASHVFYGWWDWRFLALIAFTSFCAWGSGLWIEVEVSKIGIPYAVRPEECIFPDSLMFNAYFHLTGEGAEIRTQQLISALKSSIE